MRMETPATRRTVALLVAATAGFSASPAIALDGPAGRDNAATAQYGQAGGQYGAKEDKATPLGGVKSDRTSGTTTRSQGADAASSPVDGGSLPFTGFDVGILLAAGLALIATGYGMRRRLALRT